MDNPMMEVLIIIFHNWSTVLNKQLFMHSVKKKKFLVGMLVVLKRGKMMTGSLIAPFERYKLLYMQFDILNIYMYI